MLIIKAFASVMFIALTAIVIYALCDIEDAK